MSSASHVWPSRDSKQKAAEALAGFFRAQDAASNARAEEARLDQEDWAKVYELRKREKHLRGGELVTFLRDGFATARAARFDNGPHIKKLDNAVQLRATELLAATADLRDDEVTVKLALWIKQVEDSSTPDWDLIQGRRGALARIRWLCAFPDEPDVKFSGPLNPQSPADVVTATCYLIAWINFLRRPPVSSVLQDIPRSWVISLRESLQPIARVCHVVGKKWAVEGYEKLLAFLAEPTKSYVLLNEINHFLVMLENQAAFEQNQNHVSQENIGIKITGKVGQQLIHVPGHAAIPATDAQANFVAKLLEAEGAWVSSTDLKVIKGSQERFDRIYKRLEPPVKKLIESRPRRGYRIPSAAPRSETDIARP